MAGSHCEGRPPMSGWPRALQALCCCCFFSSPNSWFGREREREEKKVISFTFESFLRLSSTAVIEIPSAAAENGRPRPFSRFSSVAQPLFFFLRVCVCLSFFLVVVVGEGGGLLVLKRLPSFVFVFARIFRSV